MRQKSDKMVALKKEQSQELITEIKLLVDMFYKTDIPIKKSEIMKHIKVSRSTLDKNPEISSYIKKMQEKQKKKKPQGIDKAYNETAMYRKLMASYVFTYQLLQEQNSFLEDAISKMEQQIKDMKED